MASKRKRTTSDEPPRGKERDAYFDEQWAAAEEEARKRHQVRMRTWLGWAEQNARTAPYSPWLVIPCNLNDFGQRPLPPGTAYWASPFVWVISPDPSGQPRAGVENFMAARVFNLGAATAAPTRVDFYWADPSVGLGPGDAHFIGTEWVEVQPMSSTVVTCTKPWIPTFVNNGHECAFVICSNHVLDPVLLPFQPWADRHVGQRNLAVLPAIAQKFLIWAPLGSQEFPAELRVLALRGVAPDGFERLENAHMTLANAAHEVLRGLRRVPEQPKGEEPPPPRVYAERLEMGQVLAGLEILEERRKGEPAAGRNDARVEGEELGELALQLPYGPGAHALIQLELRELDLAPDEIVVVNIAHIAAGSVTGGYTLVLANPLWWKDSAFAGKGGVMERTNENEKSLESLVIQYNGQARITYELARQLAEYLPLQSFKEARERIRELTIGGAPVPVETLATWIPEELFPVETTDDLVRKVSAATRTAVTLARQPGGLAGGETVRQLLAAAEDEPGREPSIPAGYFSGPSIFGSTRKEA